MSSALTLIVITVIFVFQEMHFAYVHSCFFMIKLYSCIFFLILKRTFRENFYFYILAKWAEIPTKICYSPGHAKWQFVFCSWNFLEPQNLFISMLTTRENCLIFFAKPLNCRTWTIRKSWKNRSTEGATWRNPVSLNIEKIQ